MATLFRTWSKGSGDEIARILEQTREGGFDNSGIPELAVEVKRREQLSIRTWWTQTVDQAKPQNLIPVLVYRQSRKPWMWILPYGTTGTNVIEIGRGKKIVVVEELTTEEFKLWRQARQW